MQVLPKLLRTESRTVPGVPYTIVTEYAYTSQGDIQQTTEKWVNSYGDTLGKAIVTSYDYDANGNRIAETKTRTDLDRHVHSIRTEYTYDAQNRVTLTTLKETIDAGSNAVLQTTSVAYNALGKQDTTTDAYNRVTHYVYDALGNLIETQFPNGTVTRTAYDENNHPWIVQDKAVTNSVGGAFAPATRTTYDASGRAVKVERLYPTALTRPNVSGQPAMTVSTQGAVLTTTRTFYDAIGRVQYSLDARGVVTENRYDPAGRRTNTLVYANATLDPATTETINPSTLSTLNAHPLSTSYAYDANGNQIWITDALRHTTTNVYDSANRVVEIKFPSTAENGPTSRLTAYDGLGRRLQETDEAGVCTAFAYDFRGLLLQVTLDAASTNALRTTYDYDELGNQTAQTDALGRTTRYDYDALGRRTKRTLPNGAAETTAYTIVPEASGSTTNLLRTAVTDFRGNTIVTTNDRMNRIKTKVLPPVNQGEAGTTNSYVYSPVGQLTQVSMSGDVNRTTYYEYDTLRRLYAKLTPEGELDYTYSADGSIETIEAYGTDNLGANEIPEPDAALAYGYDNLGRLFTAKDNKLDSVRCIMYHYDAVGNLDYFEYPNAVKHAYTYDERNRLKRLALMDGGANLLRSYDYTFEPHRPAHRRGREQSGQRRGLPVPPRRLRI